VLQRTFSDALYGRSERYLEWLDFVNPAVGGQAVPERASA